MYGLVNLAIRDLIIKTKGHSVWTTIRTEAGVDTDTFVKMQPYPDELTFALVGIASRQLNAPPKEIIEAMGCHWIEYTSQEGYAEFFTIYGGSKRSLVEFLRNVGNIHASVANSMPGVRMPSFDLEEQSEAQFRLHYHSERAGLAPMVVGILRGLGKLFGQPLSVSTIESKERGASHDVFEVELH
jgi:hypothetical protein